MNHQLLFIADLKQKKIDEEHHHEKPGRQIVTFLIFCNLGLWITYNFEIQKAGEREKKRGGYKNQRKGRKWTNGQ